MEEKRQRKPLRRKIANGLTWGVKMVCAIPAIGAMYAIKFVWGVAAGIALYPIQAIANLLRHSKGREWIPWGFVLAVYVFE